MKKKFLSFILAMAMLLSVFAVPVNASSESERILKQISYCYQSTLAAEDIGEPAEGEEERKGLEKRIAELKTKWCSR